MIYKKTFLTCMIVLSQHSSAESEENHENFRQAIPKPD
jgi:hypothetical protein